MKKRRSIPLAVTTGLLLTAMLFAFVWNKPRLKIEDQHSIAVQAGILYDSFMNNEQLANASFLNKPLEVSGVVNEVSKNQDGQTIAILDGGTPLGGVQCTFRDSGIVINNGQPVTVKGFCNGYTMVVLLNDCILK